VHRQYALCSNRSHGAYYPGIAHNSIVAEGHMTMPK
jgi:hypothetical protein